MNIMPWLLSPAILWCSLTLGTPAMASEFPSSSNPGTDGERVFAATGIVREVRPGANIIVIRHGAISNYMAAMTMPFKVKLSTVLAGLDPGDEITFQLHVNSSESWVDHLGKTGKVSPAGVTTSTPQTSETPAMQPVNPLLDYRFTNELGQAVSVNDFRGQALAVTFFYTRCPLPDYCPRLSKNFAEASQKLASLPGAPTNWHFLSFSFEPDFDTPMMLKAYGESYHYDSAHWSFLTGSPEKIAELARGAGVTYKSDNGTINHNFRTLIVDATGHLQMVFPTSGDLSDQIVAEIIKAAAVTNPTVAQNP
jgi:protein SCO1